MSLLSRLATLGIAAGALAAPLQSAVTADNTTQSPGQAALLQRLDDAVNLVDDKNIAQGLAALRALMESPRFDALPAQARHRALSVAAKAAIDGGQQQLGYDYLLRVAAMPQADFDDESLLLRTALGLGYQSEAAKCLTRLAQRWPDRINSINPPVVIEVIKEAREVGQVAALPLLRALYSAHWKLGWDIEPSAAWRDLILLLIDKNQLVEAVDVSAHVSNVYVLIAMRSDRRFDAVVAANPAQFDLDAAAVRELRGLQATSDGAPHSLALKAAVLAALLHRRHYAAMLALADSVLMDIRSTNYPERLYEDYDREFRWFLNERATALERLGQWDEAVAQLTEASRLTEKGGGNVDQILSLAALYCRLGRPNDALATLQRMVAPTSPLGAMALERVRIQAAVQLGDAKQVMGSLQYMNAHADDAPVQYFDALIFANQLTRAAHLLIARIQDTEQRQAALQSIQDFAAAPAAQLELDFEARRSAVIAREDVRAAVAKVGRIESYRLERQ